MTFIKYVSPMGRKAKAGIGVGKRHLTIGTDIMELLGLSKGDRIKLYYDNETGAVGVKKSPDDDGLVLFVTGASTVLCVSLGTFAKWANIELPRRMMNVDYKMDNDMLTFRWPAA